MINIGFEWVQTHFALAKLSYFGITFLIISLLYKVLQVILWYYYNVPFSMIFKNKVIPGFIKKIPQHFEYDGKSYVDIDYLINI